MFIIKEDKKGFTLTEVIIVLVILGVLALILVPNIRNMLPNDHNIKYKKAFYTIQEIVNDIANDPEICQGMNYDSTNNVYTVPNTEAARNQVLTMCYDANNNTGRTLQQEICRRLSTVEDTDCDDLTAATIISTNSGIQWRLGQQSLQDTSNNSWTRDILVDVDGDMRARNNERDVQRGIYIITVNSDGSVTAPNTDGAPEQGLLLNNPNKN